MAFGLTPESGLQRFNSATSQSFDVVAYHPLRLCVYVPIDASNLDSKYSMFPLLYYGPRSTSTRAQPNQRSPFHVEVANDFFFSISVTILLVCKLPVDHLFWMPMACYCLFCHFHFRLSDQSYVTRTTLSRVVTYSPMNHNFSGYP
jgi:hypothetical protein